MNARRTPDAPSGPGEPTPPLARLLGEGQNPMAWSLPLGRVGGVGVRLHLVFLVWGVGELVWSFWNGWGPAYALIGVAALFLVVASREAFRAWLAARAARPITEITLWPLGAFRSGEGVAPQADLRDTLIGAAWGAAMGLVLGAGVWGATHDPSAVFFAPWAPSPTLSGLRSASGVGAWPLVTLWTLHYMNILVLACNLLLPMLPLDAGVALRAGVASSRGESSGARVAASIGLGVAGALVVVAIVTGLSRLFGLAAFGGAVGWLTLQQSRFREDPAGADWWRAHAELDTQSEPAPDEGELDRILAKIAATGMRSLTKAERRTLDEETRRRRGG